MDAGRDMLRPCRRTRGASVTRFIPERASPANTPSSSACRTLSGAGVRERYREHAGAGGLLEHRHPDPRVPVPGADRRLAGGEGPAGQRPLHRLRGHPGGQREQDLAGEVRQVHHRVAGRPRTPRRAAGRGPRTRRRTRPAVPRCRRTRPSLLRSVRGAPASAPCWPASVPRGRPGPSRAAGAAGSGVSRARRLGAAAAAAPRGRPGAAGEDHPVKLPALPADEPQVVVVRCPARPGCRRARRSRSRAWRTCGHGCRRCQRPRASRPGAARRGRGRSRSRAARAAAAGRASRPARAPGGGG